MTEESAKRLIPYIPTYKFLEKKNFHMVYNILVAFASFFASHRLLTPIVAKISFLFFIFTVDYFAEIFKILLQFSIKNIKKLKLSKNGLNGILL